MAGETTSNSDFATFGVKIDLTDEGNQHVDDIVRLTFSCLAMIRSKPPQRWVFDEMRDLSVTGFRFRDATPPDSAVLSLAQSMSLYPPKALMSGPYAHTRWAPEEVTALLDMLTPERVRFYHVSQDHAGAAPLREPWYGTAYAEEALPRSFVDECAAIGQDGELAWPEPNPFVPTDFALACDTERAWHAARQRARGAADGAADGAAEPPSPSKVRSRSRSADSRRRATPRRSSGARRRRTSSRRRGSRGATVTPTSGRRPTASSAGRRLGSRST